MLPRPGAVPHDRVAHGGGMAFIQIPPPTIIPLAMLATAPIQIIEGLGMSIMREEGEVGAVVLSVTKVRRCYLIGDNPFTLLS